jgi:TfoX/Sxy family transcriptional regulator of competence genes
VRAPERHDADLFAQLALMAESLRPGLRRGAMFGCPALYVGRKMAACVYGARIGLKVPEPLAVTARQAGRARPFQPYGKAAMREWIEIDPESHDLAGLSDLLSAALDFAGQAAAK